MFNKIGKRLHFYELFLEKTKITTRAWPDFCFILKTELFTGRKKADLNFVRNDVYRFPSVSAQNRDMLKHFTCLNFKNDISDMSVIDKSRLWWWAFFLYG